MTTAWQQSAHQVAQAMLTPTTQGSTANSLATTTAPTSTSDITSNDFLTLLVSELKNQDPTQPTDPNAYVQQLVGVNSLQQLIDINKDLTKVTGGSTPAASISGTQQI